jgi:hypothetical protein
VTTERNERKADELATSSSAVTTIPIFGRAANKQVIAIAKKFKLAIELNHRRRVRP